MLNCLQFSCICEYKRIMYLVIRNCFYIIWMLMTILNGHFFQSWQRMYNVFEGPCLYVCVSGSGWLVQEVVDWFRKWLIGSLGKRVLQNNWVCECMWRNVYLILVRVEKGLFCCSEWGWMVGMLANVKTFTQILIFFLYYNRHKWNFVRFFFFIRNI